MKRLIAATSILALAIAAPTASVAAKTKAAPTAKKLKLAPPAPLADLVKQVHIPYESFKLDNGLTVLVHTDRKAPVVAVSVWYNVGSKHEPKGKTGFAHLFEHLMFNGSENAPDDFFVPLKHIGATDYNGTTWFDRTNYFETVPTGALDAALMLESDRMGYLLGAVTQEKLDNQIGVVQNEKRQGDNQPFGITEYEQLENLYPSGHPYHHSTIGSMADLSAASLDDVKQWFRDNYGPNNAILVLAGDIDTATAKQKVGAWFGAIPKGKEGRKVSVPVPDLAQDKSKTITDRIATTRVYRLWAIPGLDNKEFLPLTASASVLGGLASSRLDNALVRGQEVAVRVSANANIFAQGGQFEISADLAPGVAREKLEAALDAEIAKFIAEGPSADELTRAMTSYSSSMIKGLEQVGGFGGKAPTLAEGLLYQGDASAYKSNLQEAAALKPMQVRDVTAKWLSRPVFKLTVEPGERKEGGENRGGYVTAPEKTRTPAFYANPMMAQDGASHTAAIQAADRSKLPEISASEALDFPTIERTTLSNGMKVLFARRDSVPTIQMQISFDAGKAAENAETSGITDLMLGALGEGTTNFTAQDLLIAKERYGLSLSANSNADTITFGMNALAVNLKPSLTLFSDYIRNPAFRDGDVERVRKQAITEIKASLTNPQAIAISALSPELYGQEHPYGRSPSGSKKIAIAERLRPQDLRAFHTQWVRPDLASIYVVGNTTLKALKSQLEASFGAWKAPKTPAPVKTYEAPIPTQNASRIILINRPNSPQSMILGGWVTNKTGKDDTLLLSAANEAYGGGFLSRINSNLRETKGWSYGVGSVVQKPRDKGMMIIYAPVQADRTGDSITELVGELNAYTNGKGVTDVELDRIINGNVRQMPGQFETAGDVLGGIVTIDERGFADDYYETLGARYKGLTAAQIDAEAAREMKGKNIVFVVVGDASVVKPQLEKLGMPIEERQMDTYDK